MSEGPRHTPEFLIGYGYRVHVFHWLNGLIRVRLYFRDGQHRRDDDGPVIDGFYSNGRPGWAPGLDLGVG